MVLLTAVVAVALSIASTMVLGQVLVTRLDWRWEVVSLGWCVLNVAGLVVVIVRGLRG